jgi:hypothetical protein
MKRLLLIGLILLAGCSASQRANRQVRLARKHLEKAQALDSSVVKNDTTVVPRDTVLISPGLQIDSAINAAQPTDTTTLKVPLENSTDSVTVTTFYNKDTKKQHIKIVIPVRKDTVTLKDKVVKTTAIEIQKEKTSLRSYIWGAVTLLAIIAIIGSVIKRLIS